MLEGTRQLIGSRSLQHIRHCRCLETIRIIMMNDGMVDGLEGEPHDY